MAGEQEDAVQMAGEQFRWQVNRSKFFHGGDDVT